MAANPSSSGTPSPVLLPAFYARDTVTVARELLGHVLVSTAGGVTTSGRIVETEAYLGADDPGSHAATKGVTKRNAVMYGPPGRAYVYFTYGNHHMLNVVTEPDGVAGAVLVRAIEPMEGLEEMERRRASGRRGDVPLALRDVTNGPGKLAAALGIDLRDNGEPLDGSATLSVLASPGVRGSVTASGRIGLSSGHEMELRFYLEGNPFVSRARPGLRPTPRSRKGGRGL
jgi:DNA-3-methyladenine glycosylase